MLLDDTPAYDLIWNRVYETLKFNPSMKNIITFEIKEKYAIYAVDDMTENQLDMMEK